MWSLLAISSCFGSILATSLSYYLESPSAVYRFFARFGLGATVLFFIFFPEEDPKTSASKESADAQSAPRYSRCRELFIIALCVVSHFMVLPTPSL